MTNVLVKTRAETAIADHFAKVLDKLPGAPWMQARRKAAFARFRELGLPHRRVEAWKYTDLRARMSEAHAPRLPADDTVDMGAIEDALGPAYADLERIDVVLVNGVFRLIEMRPSDSEAANGISFLSKAMANGEADPAASAFGALDVPTEDAMLALNAAFATDGAVIRIPAGMTVRRPIHIVVLSDLADAGAIATRSLIEVGAGARVTILESHIGIGAGKRQTSAVTEIDVGAGAHVSHVKVLGEGAGATHVSTWRVRLADEAVYRAFQLTRETELARNQVFVAMPGQDCKLDISGAMLGRGGEHIDTTLVIDHVGRGSESRELFKAVLADQARAVFQGKVIVQQAAQKTDGKQMAQALMLSPDAEFDSKPELEIYADDVACGHGSTVAEIDADMLFYCRSRGIPLAEARRLLVESFVGEALDKIADDGAREVVKTLAMRWLERTA